MSFRFVSEGGYNALMRLLQRQILLTLAYTDQFYYPLTTRELWLRLPKSHTLAGVTPQVFVQVLADLWHQSLVKFDQGYWLLSRGRASVTTRSSRYVSSQTKLDSAKPLIDFCKKLPWVAGVAVTGSVSMHNAGDRDDTDLMIVTENHRLWLVRPLLIAFSYHAGKRRSWNKEEENSWCFNLWLERRALTVPPRQHTLYSAYEVCQTVWLLDRNHTQRSFLLKNGWVRQILPWLFQHKLSHVSTQQSNSSWYWPDPVSWLLNEVAYWLQLGYMNSHKTTERVSKEAAFFHPRDTKKIIYHNIKALFAAR